MRTNKSTSTSILSLLLLGALAAACYLPPRHHRHQGHQHRGQHPHQQQPPAEAQPPAAQPTEPAATTPPATSDATPALTFSQSVNRIRRGDVVTLTLSQPVPVEVYFNERPLPKRVQDGGSTLRVTIPGNATSGYFELEWQGRKYRGTTQLVVE